MRSIQSFRFPRRSARDTALTRAVIGRADETAEIVPRQYRCDRFTVAWDERKTLARPTIGQRELVLPQILLHAENVTVRASFLDGSSVLMVLKGVVPMNRLDEFARISKELLQVAQEPRSLTHAHRFNRVFLEFAAFLNAHDLVPAEKGGVSVSSFSSSFLSHTLSDGILSDLSRGIDPKELLTGSAREWIDENRCALESGGDLTRVRFTAGEVFSILATLSPQFPDLSALDFSYVSHLASTPMASGVPFAREMVSLWLRVLGGQEGVDITTPEGFRQVLPRMTGPEIKRTIMTPRGATLRGIFESAYGRSISCAVLDVVHHDPLFIEVKRKKLRPYDFPDAPLNSWCDERGEPTASARELTEMYLHAIARKLKIREWRSLENFKKVVEGRGRVVTILEPINYWGTSYRSCFRQAYGERFGVAISDLVSSDNRFAAVAAEGFRDFSLPSTGRGHFLSDRGPTSLARALVREIVERVAEGRDATSVPVFREVLQRISTRDFRNSRSSWGRSGSGLLSNVYGNSVSRAVMDLVQHDPAYSAIKEIGIQPYDFRRGAPGYWCGEKGKGPGPGARALAERLFLHRAGSRRASQLQSKPVFLEVCKEMLERRAYRLPINIWGTTGQRMLRHGYQNSPMKFLLDLTRPDGPFAFGGAWIAKLVSD